MTVIWLFIRWDFQKVKFYLYWADKGPSRGQSSEDVQRYNFAQERSKDGPSVREPLRLRTAAASEEEVEVLNRFRIMLRKLAKKMKNKWSIKPGTFEITKYSILQ